MSSFLQIVADALTDEQMEKIITATLDRLNQLAAYGWEDQDEQFIRITLPHLVKAYRHLIELKKQQKEPEMIICYECRGMKQVGVGGNVMVTCKICKGLGEVVKPPKVIRTPHMEDCKKCGSTGKILNISPHATQETRWLTCVGCGGKGRVKVEPVL